MYRFLLIACFATASATVAQPVIAGGPASCCKSGCNHSCCKTEVIYVTAKPSCEQGTRRSGGDESARVPNTNTQIVASYPMMPMFAPMYAGYAPPVQYASYPRPASDESARVDQRDCCVELRNRVNKVEDAIESIDARLTEVEELLKMQTQLLKQIKANQGG